MKSGPYRRPVSLRKVSRIFPIPSIPLRNRPSTAERGTFRLDHHVPEHLGEIVGTPAELVGVVQGIGQQLPVGIVQWEDRPEGLVICNGVDNRGSLAFAEIEGPENPPCLVGALPGVIFFFPFDIVKDPCHLGQRDEPEDPIRCVAVFTLDEDDRTCIDGHLCNVAEPVTDPLRVGSEDGDGPASRGGAP